MGSFRVPFVEFSFGGVGDLPEMNVVGDGGGEEKAGRGTREDVTIDRATKDGRACFSTFLFNVKVVL